MNCIAEVLGAEVAQARQIDDRMPLPPPGKAAAALLKKRKRQSHRRSEAFYADRNR